MSDVLVIRCRENGPLVLPATGVRIVDHQGNAFPLPPGKDNIALCRCGQSRTKPFCDGSHRKCSFQAAELAPPGS
jgi:CDGSH-type Zn-finger protein